ncbi:MAG: hypothetical protein WB868_10310 [Xanthobacteraceae bacterium]
MRHLFLACDSIDDVDHRLDAHDQIHMGLKLLILLRETQGFDQSAPSFHQVRARNGDGIAFLLHGTPPPASMRDRPATGRYAHRAPAG